MFNELELHDTQSFFFLFYSFVLYDILNDKWWFSSFYSFHLIGERNLFLQK